jgi:sulfate adenylyltransferase subunit 2
MNRLLSETEFVLREVRARFRNPAQLTSFGKDSTCLLYITRKLFGEVPWPVIHIETGYHPEELLEFRDRLTKEWNLDLIRASNPDAEATPEKDYMRCCHERKTLALRKCIEEHEFDAVLVSIRWDEQEIRSKERVMSPRDRDFKWIYAEEGGPEGVRSMQEVELKGIYFTDFPGCHHVRVHPLLNWSEADVWRFTLKERIPVNPLYFEGMRSLGCDPCTEPIFEPSKSVEEIVRKIEKHPGGERSGRRLDKERLMERLRALGYF